ncbi:hypothetical protein OC835_002542 [Tilletia horrida]|nr:hypothetical protein OC835_002542 [Tilletia horrida]
MSLAGRILSVSERASSSSAASSSAPYISLQQRPREIRIGIGSSSSSADDGARTAARRKARHWNRQKVCALCGFAFLILAIIALMSERAKTVTSPFREFAIETWDRFATGTSWLAGRPPEKGAFAGAGAILPLSQSAVQLIKSSSARASERLSWHVLWARPDIPQRLLYSDASMRLGDLDVYDALANITSPTFRSSDEYREYQSIHERLANGAPIQVQAKGTRAQKLDKWKMLPMLAHAWQSFPNQKWYIASEDDTYIFWSTAVRWLSQWNATDLKYFGHVDKAGPGMFKFADIGAGLALSQGIMSRTFGSDTQFASKYDKVVKRWTSGDIVLADVLSQQPSMHNLEPKGGKDLFLKSNVRQVIFTDKLLYAPVLSLHNNAPFELQAMRVFEEQLLPTLEEGDGIRYCDLLEHFAPATVAMSIQMHLKTLEEGQTLATSGLDLDSTRKDWYALEANNLVCGPDCARSRNVPYDASFCATLCEEDRTCLAWALTPNYCAISRGAFRIGQPVGNVTSGWKVGRIAALLHAKPCKDAARRAAQPIAQHWGA